MFKNAGAKWDREPELVKDHDFRSEADGIAVPYGVYDVQAKRGMLFVGTSYDTPRFATDHAVARGRYARTTVTSTGLRVRAHLARKHYRKGISISDAEMKALTIVRDDELPAWNDTIAPG